MTGSSDFEQRHLMNGDHRCLFSLSPVALSACLGRLVRIQLIDIPTLHYYLEFILILRPRLDANFYSPTSGFDRNVF
jgi:hypothetical protein